MRGNHVASTLLRRYFYVMRPLGDVKCFVVFFIGAWKKKAVCNAPVEL